MKIKCPFCKNVYDPEACDNTCPACSKKLMVSVFKKKPENKPGASPVKLASTPPPAPKPPPPMPPPVPEPPAVGMMTEFVAPKPPIIVPVIKPPPATIAPAPRPQPVVAAPPPAPEPAAEAVPAAVPMERKKATIKVEVAAQVPPTGAPVARPLIPLAELKKATQLVAPPPPEAPAPVVVAPPPPPPAEQTHEKKHAHHGQPKAGLDLVISIRRIESADWDAVIRVPVQVFKFANLIPARAREAIESEGIAFEELRKATEHADHIGPLLDIQTQAQRVHIAIEPHV